jgi:amino acid transporter
VFRPLKRLLVGSPLATRETAHQRLSNRLALPIFASDALSSVAYATEEILWVLVLASAASGLWTVAVSAGIIVLLGILIVSYRQTVRAYPGGGGAYIVAKDNLGRIAGLTAGGALLVDYILTAAVSVAAGVAAIASAVPWVAAHRVSVCGGVLFVIVILNLRGVRESGRAFAAPTYAFIAAIGLFLVWGLLERPFVHTSGMAFIGSGPVTAWLLMRAFASGCTALTGVEAIANGVQAFQPPEAENARITLRRMGLLLAGLFGAITVLAILYGAVPNHDETVISQIARKVFGGKNVPYYVVQGATALILVLAANTSFAGFPRLASIMARDRFLPRQLANQGDRLAFSNGILLLGLVSWVLILLFGGEVHALLPLYAVGVFLSFTLSQAGMVARWVRQRETGWVPSALVNLAGCTATGTVLVVIIATKFTHGAWLVCVIIPGLVMWFRSIERHYARAARELSAASAVPQRLEHTVVIPVAGIHRGVLRAVEYARSLTSHVRAVTVQVDEAATQELASEWRSWLPDVPLDVVESPYRSLVDPLLRYLDDIQAEKDDALVTVVIPEFVPRRFWHRMLHNQSALLLVAALSARPNVVVTTVRIPLTG